MSFARALAVALLAACTARNPLYDEVNPAEDAGASVDSLQLRRDDGLDAFEPGFLDAAAIGDASGPPTLVPDVGGPPPDVAGMTDAATDVALFVDTPPAVISAVGLVAYYKMDDALGATDARLRDHGPFRNDGRAFGSTPSLVQGPVGTATSLPGNAYIAVPRSAALDGLTTTYSLAAWIKPGASGLDPWRSIVSRQRGTNYEEHYGLYLESGVVRAELGEGTAMPMGCAAYRPPMDRWTHIAAVRDGTAATIYVDGVELCAGTSGRSATADATSLVIGGNQNESQVAEYFGGGIDEVVVYGRALTPTEVKELASGRTPDVPPR